MFAQQFRYAVILLAAHLVPVAVSLADESSASAASRDVPARLREYFEEMSVAKPFIVRDGQPWQRHRQQLRDYVLECAGLQPLPQRVELDVHMSEPLDHPWCTVRRVSYQLWPHVYSTGLLFMPKKLGEQPAPAVLCPHGHWADGNADPTVQARCLNLARLGYVTFSSTQLHYEDLVVGISHQTVMIWNNMRALDFLQSLPEVDGSRVGVAGASGGGLQTEVLLAVDDRVKAATIVGLTCDFRQIMFPDGSHCDCNHFPGIMRRTDHPEISALGLPCPVAYLTMNDWTRSFETTNFPTIRRLYARHGVPDHVFCRYYDTDHNYDQAKRELTYWWLNRWLVGCQDAEGEREPETVTFPVGQLKDLAVAQPGDRGFAELSRMYQQQRAAAVPAIATRDDWQAYRCGMARQLRDLLGEDVQLASKSEDVSPESRTEGDLVIERVGYASEGPVVVPCWVLRPLATGQGKLPVEVIMSADGKDALLQATESDSPRERARRGALIVLPDVRTCGESLSTGTKDKAAQERAWQRNSIVWGRPVAGMAVTDLRAVLDGLACRPDADVAQVRVMTRGCGDLAAAALFCMALDQRLTAADLDCANACYGKRNLAVVPHVLWYGDLLQWAALAADRRVTLRNVPAEVGDADWLGQAFRCLDNATGLEIVP